jgi:hypothetical protein
MARAAIVKWIGGGILLVFLASCEQRPAVDSTANDVRGVGPGTTEVPKVTASAEKPAPAEDALANLFARMWRVMKAPESPPKGAMWVFLRNGTLLETSCVETYRVATWSADPKNPKLLRVVEDRRPAFTAEIVELNDTTLRVEQKLTRQPEVREITFTGVEGETVCPDLR